MTRGMSLKIISGEAFVYSVFSRNKEKPKPLTWRSVSSEALQSLQSLAMCQASTSGQVLARARVQVLQNSGSRMVVLRFTTLSARDRHWRNPRKKNYRERSNIKSVRVSALTGSVPRKMAERRQKVSAPCGNRTKVARQWPRLSATHINL